MEASLIETMLRTGPLGAVIVALAIAFWRQSIELRRVETSRVEDAKKVTQTLLEINDRWNAAIAGHAQAIEKLVVIVDELRRNR